MPNYIIIRGNTNGGKTTTAGVLFEKLKDEAQLVYLFKCNFSQIDCLQFNKDGSTRDFIAVLLINGIVVIIISQGDVSGVLQDWLNKLTSIEFLQKLTQGRIAKVDIIVCCARSQMRRNSTIEMLHKRIPERERSEFWTTLSERYEDRFKIKEAVVQDIMQNILNYRV